MKIHYLTSIVVTFFWFNFIQSQNLVINPSFEITNTNCSALGGESFRTDLNPSWDNANSNIPGDSCSSPDLFSACNILFGNPLTTIMPGGAAQGLGYQWSRTGTRHAGLITHSAPFGFVNNYREYIQGSLSTPLVAGQTYCVSMYVSLGEAVPFASNNIGVYFGATQYVRDACASGSGIFNLTPQLNYGCAPITDTTSNWVRLQWDYVAAGGEQWILIGNFYNSASTSISNTGHGAEIGPGIFMHPFAYYFIDDVSVVPNSCCYADIESIGTICQSDPAVNLNAIPPLGSNCSPASLTGTWSGPGITNPTLGTFNPATAGIGNHTISFTLACGYVATTTITVSPCTSLNVCEETNGTLTVSNGVGPYNWQTQTTTQDCSACFIGCTIPPGCAVNATTWTTYATGTNAAAPATFPAQVVDATGTIFTITSLAAIPDCSATPPCPTITVTSSAQTNITCAGQSNGAATVSASGGTAPYTYSWTPGNLTGATQTALAAGTYTVTATDNNQCTGSTTVTITAPEILTATSTTSQSVCGATNGGALVTPQGGTAPYTYSWSPTGGSASQATDLASGVYTVTISDANNCTITHNLTITSIFGATATISNSTNASCANTTNGSATVSVTGGATPYTYAWSPSGGSAATASNLAPGNYTVTVTDANQCVSTATVTITAPPAITATSSTTPASCGVADGSATVVAQGGSGTFTYAWSPSGGTNATASNLTSGPYTVTITDGNQCSITQNVNVPSNGGPTVTIGNVSNVSCAGLANGTATAQLTGGTAPFTYQWSPSGGSNATASNLGAGTYTVTVTDGSGCIVSETVTISNPTAITIIETITDENCGASDGAISTLVAGGSGNYTYNWSPGGETTASLTNVEFGDYTLIVTDANGCTATETYTVEQIGGLIISVSPTNTTIEQGDSVQLVASGATTYTWIPSDGLSCDDCPNPFASPIETTTYTVIGEDANGCSGSTEVTVFLQPICGQVFVPTIFSPNGDGNNDFVCVDGNCILELDFSIYNRWGEVVFTTTDSTICWDGTHKGKPVNSGTFVYKMYVRLIDGTTKTEAGNISVVK